MIAAILIVFLLAIFSMIGFLVVLFTLITLKEEFEDKSWMDNSEFDYGHDVHHHTEF